MFKKRFGGFLSFVLVFTAVFFALPAAPANAAGTTYYVDSISGLDTNNGTSSGTAWKTLAKVSATTFAAGDTILFKRDSQFRGTLTLNGNGTSTNKITVDAYGAGNKPVIIGDSTAHDTYTDAAVKLTDRSWWVIQNIEIQAPVTNGMLLKGVSNTTIQYVDFTNIRYTPPNTPDVTDGNSITIIKGTTQGGNILIDHCTFKKVSKGVWIQSGDNINVQYSYFYDVHDIPALFAGHLNSPYFPVTNSRFAHNVFDYTTVNNTGWNVFMFGGTDNCYFEYNEIKNSNPNGAWDHQVYDFDTAVKNSYIQYNYSHDNLGDLMHNYWCPCDSSDPKWADRATINGTNYFRYNVSVNEATLYWHGAVTYGLQVYNNTFYDFKGNFGRNIIAADVSDTVFKNNIFHHKTALPGTLSLPSGSDYNLYYNATKPAAETHSVQGNPSFVYGPNPPHGLQILTGSPAKNAGVSIAGNGGLDYWGNTLYNGAPDIGAHEFNGAAVPNNVNLAMNKTVTTSSSIENWGWYRTTLVDGTINALPNTAGWSSALGITTNHTEWAKVDLGAGYTVNKVNLWPRNDNGYTGAAFPVDFTIDVSTDNVNWTTVVTKTGYPRPANQVQSFAFANQTARYVRLNATGLRYDGANYIVQLSEMEVLNDTSPTPAPYVPSGNLALAKDVTASSSVENWGWFKSKLTDGMRNSVSSDSAGWHSALGVASVHSENVMVDLGAIVSVSKVDLYPRNDAGYVGVNFPANFTIQTSTDAVNWTTRVTRTGYPQPGNAVQSFTFTAANARFIKVAATNIPANAAFNLAELEVYN